MKQKPIWLGAMLIFIVSHFLNADLKKIASIGSNEINYVFFVASSAVFDDDYNIYVADGKGSYVRKYNSRGIFIKEIGKYGQGPGDFSDVLSGMYYAGRELDLLDSKNMRIAVMDLDLNIKKYIQIRHTAHALSMVNSLYYLLCPASNSPFYKIVVYDDLGIIHKEFFNQGPSFMNKMPTTKIEMAAMKIFSGLNFHFNRESNEIVIVPKNPGNTIEVFIYSPEGKLLRKLDVDHLVNYRFPFEFKLPLKYPDKGDWISIRSIHCLPASKLLIEYSIVTYEGGKDKRTQTYILIIDTVTGKLVHKEMIDPNMNIMDVKGNTICVRTEEEDICKLVVYELELK